MAKMEDFIEDGENLHNSSVRAPAFKAWRNTVICFLKKKYGEKSHEAKYFDSISYFSPYTENEQENKINFQDGLKTAILCLKGYILNETNSIEENEQKAATEMEINNNIFIVHGRNNDIKAQVANFLLKLKINPIILHEQMNKGQTIIEKFEGCSNVQAAIVLFTSDDVGRLKEDSELEDRARQNVVFEAGFFIGKLGRKRTIILIERGLKMPSDLDGLVHTEIDSNDGWQLKVARELKGLNFDIDMNCL